MLHDHDETAPATTSPTLDVALAALPRSAGATDPATRGEPPG
jgi:hypothetical protein